MRYVGWLLSVALLAGALGGCSDTRAGRRQLADQIDKARRLKQHAVALMGDPRYVLDSKAASQPAIAPAPDRAEAGRLLDEARQTLLAALESFPNASASDRASARLLLGGIEFARGGMFADDAERCRQSVELLRHATTARRDMLQDAAGLVTLTKSLGNLPKKNIEDFRAQAAKELGAFDGQLKTIDEKIANLEKDNETLAQDSSKLLDEARQLRQQSETGRNTAGLEPLKQSQDLEGKASEKASQIAGNKQTIESLQVDKSLLLGRQTYAKAKVSVFEKALAKMDEDAKAAQPGQAEAQGQVTANWQEIRGLADQIGQLCKQTAELEKKAIDAWTAAADSYAKAERDVSEANDAARAAGQQADDLFLATTIGWKGNASLALADLQSRQAATARANAALADELGRIAKQLDLIRQPAEAIANAYPVKGQDATNLAVENYKTAESATKLVVEKYLEVGSNIKWIYQGQLASEYLGRYLLTGDQGVLKDADDFVKDALKNKDKSPYLASVVELQRLIQSVAKTPGPTTTPTE